MHSGHQTLCSHTLQHRQAKDTLQKDRVLNHTSALQKTLLETLLFCVTGGDKLCGNLLVTVTLREMAMPSSSLCRLTLPKAHVFRYFRYPPLCQWIGFTDFQHKTWIGEALKFVPPHSTNRPLLALAHSPGPPVRQPLPQRRRSRAALRLPTALPCPAMGPMEPDLPRGPCPGLSLSPGRCPMPGAGAALVPPWLPCSWLGRWDGPWLPGPALTPSMGSPCRCALTKCFLLDDSEELRQRTGQQIDIRRTKCETMRFIRHILISSSTPDGRAAAGVMGSEGGGRRSSRRCCMNSTSSEVLLGSALVTTAQRREKRQKQRHLNNRDD